MDVKRIGISGSCGNVAYSLLFRIANGELLGQNQRIALHLLDQPAALTRLNGVVLELEDCAFPLLDEVRVGSDPYEVFKGVDIVFLLGAKPRSAGMERRDLLLENGKIFIEQGKALKEVAADNAVVLVVGNPCNTNCLIAKHYDDKHRFFSMTMLDQNRAVSLLAKKTKRPLSAVKGMTIWGNHSSTQVPDFFHAQIDEKPLLEVIDDLPWLQNDFIADVQSRGAAVITALGRSSAGSAAHAALKSMKALLNPTPLGSWFSMGVVSDGNSYGIKPGIVFSFPCYSRGDGDVTIIPHLFWNDFLQKKIALTEKELLEEKEIIRHLL
jgi:malate dehydrogenase